VALDLRGFNTVVQVPSPPASQMAPAAATYGPTGAVVVQQGGVLGANPAQLKVYAGVAALAGILLLRGSAPGPRKREVDTIVVVSFLINVAYSALKINAKRRVQEGKTQGISGYLAQAWSI
jgi:hypothetical protein